MRSSTTERASQIFPVELLDSVCFPNNFARQPHLIFEKCKPNPSMIHSP